MIQTLFGPEKKAGFLERLQNKMAGAVEKTRASLVSRVDEILRGKTEISPETLRELETALIAADVGAATAREIIAHLRQAAAAEPHMEAETARQLLQNELIQCLKVAVPPVENAAPPRVIMLVGVNGAGKTTTLGKLTQRYRDEGKTVILCAADTFRAAAGEQLQAWAERTGTEMISQKPGADPSAVIFDALSAAKARGTDCVLIDTAGRLHTKDNLMQELAKMRRTAGRVIAGAPHEIYLVLDATTGQNGLQQARQFTAAAGLTGVVVTKLDGTARGGIVIAIARELKLPVCYAGVGEKLDDLIPFQAETFVHSLFASPAANPRSF